MTTIFEYKQALKNKPTTTIQLRLADTLEEIKFLESIYETGGKNSHYSKAFRDAAYTERQDLCQLSSACYSILRERGDIDS